MVAALGVGVTWNVTRAADEAPKYNIKEVMKKAHKEGLLKKVLEGATKEDAQELLDLYTSLSQNKPPKGEAAAWKSKTDAILEAAKEVVAGKEGAKAKLEKAANCGECHKEHKPG